jgi:hypothetical protein
MHDGEHAECHDREGGDQPVVPDDEVVPKFPERDDVLHDLGLGHSLQLLSSVLPFQKRDIRVGDHRKYDQNADDGKV